jgi:hypothetical protein
MTRDEIRTAGLLFGEELALGLIEPEALRGDAVQRAVRGQAVPSTLSRRYQRRQLQNGRLTNAGAVLTPRMDARRAVLGDAAHARPKLLLRVSVFPAADAYDDEDGAGTSATATLHGLLRDAGVPYLMAVTPRVAQSPLQTGPDEWRRHNDDERALLAELRRDGVAFGLYGLDGRTRTRKASRRSEFSGLKRKAVEHRLDTALDALRDEALHADVFIPPYDRFDAVGWPALASRFDVICGGPQSIDSFGFHRAPSWRGDAVWLPAYPPLHGPAAAMLPAVHALVDDGVGLWVPLAIDAAHEAQDDFRGLGQLAAVLGAGQLARPWDDFLLAVRASRQLTATLTR